MKRLQFTRYNLFTRKSSIISLLLLLVLMTSCTPQTSGNVNNNKQKPLVNGNFEIGSLTGWEIKSGDAFTMNSLQVSGGDASRYRHEGDFYLDSTKLGNSRVGVLASEEFILTENGYIGMLLGGARDNALSYVALVNVNGDMLTKISNKYFNNEVKTPTLYRYKLDASKYIGEKLHLLIVDEDESDEEYSGIMVDDIILGYTGNESEGTLVSDAREYVTNHKGEVKDTYRHTYHLMPTIGWMNDPNGLVYYNGNYHLFYQHFPYATRWDTMHWGHAISKDLIKWEDAGVALAPSVALDAFGVFSGGAIEGVNNELHLFYTAVARNGIQQQAMATSFDGLNFSKRNNNPIITTGMSNGSRIFDFRDPYVYLRNGVYYALVGGKNEGPGGQILLYSSTNLLDWRYVGQLYTSTIIKDGMFECPNILTIDGRDIILSSPQGLKNDDYANNQNLHSVTYQIGEIDYKTGVFANHYGIDTMTEFDKGFDFYATQALTHDNQNIMLAWMNMWSRSLPSAQDGWVGAVTLPRDLTLVDDHIYQAPIKAITNYYTNEENIKNITLTNTQETMPFTGNTLRFKAEIDVSNLNGGHAGFEVLASEYEKTRIYYDDSRGAVVFDRRQSGLKIEAYDDNGEIDIRYAKVEPENGLITLEIFIDVSSVEVFINNGYYTMSGTVFPKENTNAVTFFSKEGTATLNTLQKHDIEVI